MFSKILRARHAIGLAGALLFAAVIVSPVRAADEELARYKAAEKIAKAQIAKFDVLDFDVFTNQKWDRLKESHSQDIAVHWPDGHVTRGIDRPAGQKTTSTRSSWLPQSRRRILDPCSRATALA